MMEKHSKKEDGIALIVGSFMVALGVFFLSSAQLLTGGTAGLALLLSQLSLLSFGTLYFFINLPFYALAWQRFGRQFAMNSLLSGALVSLFADNLHYVIQFNLINDLFCAVAGGLLIGIGMLILFRHRSSLGGFNVMCLLIQDRTGISVGKTQLTFGLQHRISFAAFCFWLDHCIINTRRNYFEYYSDDESQTGSIYGKIPTIITIVLSPKYLFKSNKKAETWLSTLLLCNLSFILR